MLPPTSVRTSFIPPFMQHVKTSAAAVFGQRLLNPRMQQQGYSPLLRGTQPLVFGAGLSDISNRVDLRCSLRVTDSKDERRFRRSGFRDGLAEGEAHGRLSSWAASAPSRIIDPARAICSPLQVCVFCFPLSEFACRTVPAPGIGTPSWFVRPHNDGFVGLWCDCA
jgi:hypothetical protein